MQKGKRSLQKLEYGMITLRWDLTQFMESFSEYASVIFLLVFLNAAHIGASLYRCRSMPGYYVTWEIFGDSVAYGWEELVANDIARSSPCIHNDASDENDFNIDDDATPHNEEVGDEHISTARGCNVAPRRSYHQTTRRQSVMDAMVVVVIEEKVQKINEPEDNMQHWFSAANPCQGWLSPANSVKGCQTKVQ